MVIQVCMLITGERLHMMLPINSDLVPPNEHHHLQIESVVA